MKSNLSFFLIGLVFVMSILACDVTINGVGMRETVRGTGEVAEQSRDVGNITGVRLAMQGTLHLVMDSSETLRIEAEDNLLEYIETDIRSGELVIETRQDINLRPTKPIHYYLTVQELESIEISSSGDVETGDLETGSLSITISSSGDVTIPALVADSISVKISSSGNLDIMGGQVQDQTVTISSSGEYRARDLASVLAEVTLTSSGGATIRVSDRLTGRLSSSGNLSFIGNPEVNVRETSSGRVVQIKE